MALTVDADDATLEGIVEALGPDLLQLHGHETPARVLEVKRKFGRAVMKVLPVEPRLRSRKPGATMRRSPTVSCSMPARPKAPRVRAVSVRCLTGSS